MTKKMKLGGLAMLSPALALAETLKSGQPEGLLKLAPMAIAGGSLEKDKEKKNKGTAKMAKGGMVRGDGCAQRGKTKGKMR